MTPPTAMLAHFIQPNCEYSAEGATLLLLLTSSLAEIGVEPGTIDLDSLWWATRGRAMSGIPATRQGKWWTSQLKRSDAGPPFPFRASCCFATKSTR
jgi:hypothetical protein